MNQQQDIRQAHPYFMYDAIMAQPEAAQAMLRQHPAQAQNVASVAVKKRRLYLVGIGTSWHAALVAGH